MRCYKNALDALLRAFLFAVCLLTAGSVYAGSIEARRAAIGMNEDGYTLTADFSLDIGQALEEAVAHGVPLYFILEFDLTRPRWYWANEHVAGRKIIYRLSYSALTQQYRISNGPFHQNFAALAEALRAIARITELPVAERSQLRLGESYQAALRLSLDRSQLPKPFQLDAFANRDWQVDSKTLRWNYTAGAEGR